MQYFLIVHGVKVTQGTNEESHEAFRKVFDVWKYLIFFPFQPLRAHGRDDEAVLSIVLRNSDVSIPVGAPRGLTSAPLNDVFIHLLFHGNDFVQYV